jgi:carboxylesterase type B
VHDPRVASLSGDILIIAPMRLTAQHLSCSNPPVYKYRFNVTDPLFQLPAPFGAAHAMELQYVWNSPQLRTVPGLARVVDIMTRSWISFFVHLDPNYHGLLDVPQWEKYGKEGREMHVKLDSVRLEADNYRKEGIEFINAVKERGL